MVVKLVEASLSINFFFWKASLSINISHLFFLLCFGLNHEPNPSILK